MSTFIDVSATVTLGTGYTLGQVQTSINNALASYIQSLRQSWADANDLNVYSCDVFVSRVSAAIIGVAGVANVTDVTINGAAADIRLIQSGAVQQLPTLGEVVLNV